MTATFAMSRSSRREARAAIGDEAVCSGAMRLGIRLQLLLALGSLLVLAFVPLFFAVASLTRATLAQSRVASATALGRAVAGHVTARASHGGEDLGLLLDAQIDAAGVAAIGIYDEAGALVAARGVERMDVLLPRTITVGAERVAQLPSPRGAALLVVVPAEDKLAFACGGVGVIARVDLGATPSAALVRLFALYTGIVALALLVFAYISMTRLVVRPIDRLSREARRVADGARRLEAPQQGAREMIELGTSLEQMTAKLRADEEALRAKIAEVERYAADLKQAQERLVRSERLASVGRLSAGLAHEIGNPLAAILGFQELLLGGGLDEADQRDFLQRMKRETERIHRILRDLLDFARPARAGREGEPEAAGDVREAVNDVLALVKPQKAFRDVELAAEIAPDLPRVTLSHQRIVQVVLNLVLNAADATPRGHVTVRAEQAGEGRVRIAVEDDGPGIAPEVRDKLFEPFVTTKPVGEGTGLGLAVCRGLVEAAAGTIAVEARGEGGARFLVELPRVS
jgi:signal transduction histidine kinase